MTPLSTCHLKCVALDCNLFVNLKYKISVKRCVMFKMTMTVNFVVTSNGRGLAGATSTCVEN